MQAACSREFVGKGGEDDQQRVIEKYIHIKK
jgi:hypothetical protein